MLIWAVPIPAVTAVCGHSKHLGLTGTPLVAEISCALIVHYRFSAECIISLIQGLWYGPLRPFSHNVINPTAGRKMEMCCSLPKLHTQITCRTYFLAPPITPAIIEQHAHSMFNFKFFLLNFSLSDHNFQPCRCTKCVMYKVRFNKKKSESYKR